MLQEIKDKLVSLEPGLFVASDQAQQMAVDISAEDDARNKQRVQAVRDKVKDVLTEVDSRMQQSERLQQEREDFEDTIGLTIAWLEQKEDILASQGTLNLDSDKVNPVLRKHQVRRRYCNLQQGEAPVYEPCSLLYSFSMSY